MRKNLCEEFKHFKGQPVEVITEDHKYCGIDVEAGDNSVVLLDKCGRLIRIEYRHIEAVVEPQMALNPLCVDIDCTCNESTCGCACARDNRNSSDSYYD